MVVDDLHVVRVTRAPAETDPPPPVDTDAVLIASIALQFLQAIARRNPEVREVNGRIQHSELPKRDSLHLGSQSRKAVPLEEPLGITVVKALDHPA